MRNIKLLQIKNSVVALSLALLCLCSCDTEWIDSDLNIDPDSPGDVPMNLLLPAIQQKLGYNLHGSDNVRTSNIWIQQFDGVSRQSFTEARYQITPADVNGPWGSTYRGILMNTHVLVEKSKEEGKESPHYTGVGQVIQAATLGITTDLYGDIPFSDALQGGYNILTPVYDSQEKVYDTIFNLVDMAVTNLNSSENAIAVTGDVIYDGNTDQWERAANSIGARHYLQLSNILGEEAYTKALAAAADGFSSNADNFSVPFEDANRNPLFKFMEERGDIRIASTLMDMLKNTDDPRLAFYAAENADGEFVGSRPGSENEAASDPGSYVAGADAEVVIMSYAELKFIAAEAHLQLGNTQEAQSAYEEAVQASLLRVTGDAQNDWFEANIAGETVTLEDIWTQKYIDGFGTSRPYADWRRTGFPDLELAEGAVLQQIPTRFPYPQSEYDYNNANVPAVTTTDKVWWDQ